MSIAESDVLWKKVRYLSKEFYPIFKVWIVKNAVVYIRHPDDIKVHSVFFLIFNFELDIRSHLYIFL